MPRLSAIHPIIQCARNEGRSILTMPEAAEVLGQAGINVAETRLASSAADAAAVAADLGFPVALKIASPDIAHKTDADGVRLGLANATQVKTAFLEITAQAARRFPAARLQGIYVQPMAPPGVEVIIGMKRDAQFGPVLMFGLGGVWVELMQDVALRVTPIARRDAAEMVQEIKGYPLLAGYRGAEPVDTTCLENILLTIDGLARDCPEIREIDLNPVIAGHGGAVVVDARILFKNEQE
jgi:acyl-CoA synthetase (NDP forming)